jgi:hypothetical protein
MLRRQYLSLHGEERAPAAQGGVCQRGRQVPRRPHNIFSLKLLQPLHLSALSTFVFESVQPSKRLIVHDTFSHFS